MNPAIYSVLHVASIILLTGWTFYAFAAPPESKKKVMMITGVLSLFAAVGAFGLQARLHVGWPGWLIVKIFCWLALSSLAGFGYRKRESAGMLAAIVAVIVIIAVTMVYTRPF